MKLRRPTKTCSRTGRRWAAWWKTPAPPWPRSPTIRWSTPKSIYLFGYGLGGTVALYTAALEPKVAGVVCVAGFTPMRTDTAATGTGGIARFAIDRPLLPRLGFFIGSESKIPYDFDDILASIAPRPVYVVNPLYDRGANFQDVHAALGEARKCLPSTTPKTVS